MRKRNKLKLFEDYNGFAFDDTIRYLFPSVTDKLIKVVTDNVNIVNNDDGTFTINQRIYPEEMYEINGELYMKWRGEWYGMKGEHI